MKTRLESLPLAGVLVFLVSLITLISCNECPGDAGETNIFDSGFFFELHDKTTDENLLNLFFGRYNQDTVKILREDLSREESFYFVDASGRAWFRCLENPEDLEGLKRKVIKTFFVSR
jgi:hypothetical protein